jgi:hypothetical protein
MLKTIVATVVLVMVTGAASAQTYQRPHIDKNGRYSDGGYRTTPNGTQLDNYSTKGNVNPYSGKKGNRNPRY